MLPGYNENQGSVSDALKRAPQPAQELIHPPRVTVVMEHPLEEDG